MIRAWAVAGVLIFGCSGRVQSDSPSEASTPGPEVPDSSFRVPEPDSAGVDVAQDSEPVSVTKPDSSATPDASPATTQDSEIGDAFTSAEGGPHIKIPDGSKPVPDGDPAGP